jgi:hypothetical protein
MYTRFAARGAEPYVNGTYRRASKEQGLLWPVAHPLRLDYMRLKNLGCSRSGPETPDGTSWFGTGFPNMGRRGNIRPAMALRNACVCQGAIAFEVRAP